MLGNQTFSKLYKVLRDDCKKYNKYKGIQMTVFKNVVVACLMALFVASCGADSKEKVEEDGLLLLEEITTILEGVKNKETAEAAKPKLEALVKKVQDLKARRIALNLTEEEMKTSEKNKERFKGILVKLSPILFFVDTNEEVKPVLEDVIKKIKES